MITNPNPGDEVLLKEQEQRISLRVEGDEVWEVLSVSAGLTSEGGTVHRVALQRVVLQPKGIVFRPWPDELF